MSLKDDFLKPQRDFMYLGDKDLTVWGFTPFSVNRDSNILEQSNWRVISKDLAESFPNSIDIERFNHWLCGWVEQLMVNTKDSKAMHAIEQWIEKLEDYAVADEDDWCSLEQDTFSSYYDDFAYMDIGSYAQEHEIACLLDEDGFYSPNPEQIEVLKDLVTNCYLDGGEDTPFVRITDALDEAVKDGKLNV